MVDFSSFIGSLPWSAGRARFNPMDRAGPRLALVGGTEAEMNIWNCHFA
jgi:hypothetical protein